MSQRRLFLAALVAFAVWVAALGALAVRSGRKPQAPPTTHAHPAEIESVP